MKKQTVTMKKEKDTKNTSKYVEVLEQGKPMVMGTLYLQKWAAESATDIKVTVEEA